MESPPRLAATPSLVSVGRAVAVLLSWTLQTTLTLAMLLDSSSASLAVPYRTPHRDSYHSSDPYLDVFDEEWATMSGRVQKPKCVDIPANLSLCQNISYHRMMLPNLLQHDSLSEVTQQARSWVALVGIHCHPDTKIFLCSLFSPVCLDRAIYPCRTLCEGVRDNCLQRMKHYGFDWPAMLTCDKFPEDNDMCIKLIHDVIPDNNCSACKHPATYEAIIDNYCRAEFVSRIKIERTEQRNMDLALILKKSKRYYKKENITKKERSAMEPLILKGASCVCDAINDTSKRYLLMGSHKGGQLVVSYVMEFLKKDKEFQRAFKDMRKGNVCKSIIDELSSGDVDKKVDRGEKDDGICIACKMPVRYVTIVENYCLADFVLRASVTGVETRDGHQALLMKKRRKNYRRGLSKKEVKAMVPVLDGKEGCTCDLVTQNKKAKFLVFGSKRDDKYNVVYITQFNTKDKEFKKALKAIRKGDACVNILQGSRLGIDDDLDKPGSGFSGAKGAGKGGKGNGKGRKGKKGKKGKRKGKKGRKGKRKGKKGRKGGKKQNNQRNATASDVLDNVA